MSELQEFMSRGQAWYLLSEVLESVGRGADYLNPMFIARIPSEFRARLRRPGWPWVVNEEGAHIAIEQPWLNKEVETEEISREGTPEERAQKVENVIRRRIKVKSELPGTAVLAGEFGVSNAVMAKIMGKLADRGLVSRARDKSGAPCWLVNDMENAA
ncbi:hypothetical protein [Kitasatospora sp. NPDC051914]|uniref:hypothetical protein n=1 Tax=Kitasatospora sp. NPDC051914 TaxID=3154945 RepID=UPI003431D728